MAVLRQQRRFRTLSEQQNRLKPLQFTEVEASYIALCGLRRAKAGDGAIVRGENTCASSCALMRTVRQLGSS